MKKKLFCYGRYFFGLFSVFGLCISILSTKETTSIMTSNMNMAKSIGSNQLQEKYIAIQELTKEKPAPIYASFEEALSHIQEGRVAFVGKLTAYGPDCIGCGGSSACAPRQNFQNGNIYFEDSTYGKVRILAADKALPCGSIVRVSNISIYDEPILAIVMDRGGAIKGNHLDLLFTSENNLEGFSTQNDIQFEILRYGF